MLLPIVRHTHLNKNTFQKHIHDMGKNNDGKIDLLLKKVLPIVVMRESKYNILFQNCLVVRHPVYYIYLSPDTSKP